MQDPVSTSLSALKQINALKAAVDSAKEQEGKAKELMLVVEQFEVVLAMIPSRGDASALTKIRESNQESETKNGEQTTLSAIKDGGKGQSSGGGTDTVAVADLESTVAVKGPGGINCKQQNFSKKH